MFQSAVCAVPWGWKPAKNCLLDCSSPVELSYASCLGHQGQTIEGHPLCGLHMLAGFRKTIVECREWGLLTGFRKAMGKCLDYLYPQASAVPCLCVPPLALGWGWKNAMTNCAHQLYPGGSGILQLFVLTDVS